MGQGAWGNVGGVDYGREKDREVEMPVEGKCNLWDKKTRGKQGETENG